MLYMAIIVVKSVQQDATIEFLFSAIALLYMIRVTISPIISSTMLYIAIIVVKSVQQDATIAFLISAMALHVSCDNLTHHQDYNAVYGHYKGEISSTRCNNCVFILRNGFTFFG